MAVCNENPVVKLDNCTVAGGNAHLKLFHGGELHHYSATFLQESTP
jgi:hypothetical protein